MSAAEFREPLLISASHPALPGHFAGNPVVPGAVLLDRVAAAVERWRGQHIVALPQVKFMRALRPGEAAELVLSDDGKSIRFSILHNDAAIANGVIEARP